MEYNEQLKDYVSHCIGDPNVSTNEFMDLLQELEDQGEEVNT